jgi:hypothetical protein
MRAVVFVTFFQVQLRATRAQQLFEEIQPNDVFI